MSTHGNLEARRPLSKASCSWQRRISHALSLDQQMYNYSSILDTPSGKRTSSFVFQVGPTMDLTYLTRSIHTSFKGSIGMGEKKAALPLLIFCGNSQWIRGVKERVASVIFSYSACIILTRGHLGPWSFPHYNITCLKAWHTDILYIYMTTLVCSLFHSLLLPWRHFIPKYIICPLSLPKGGPWNAVRPTYNYGLISNCLFLRIIPNGCAAKPLSTLSWDYSGLKPAVLVDVSPATGAILIWGRRLKDLSVRT